MINIAGMEFNVEVVQVIEDLRTSLAQNNILLLQSIKVVGNNVMISCPFHKDGQERKPSCGVSINDTYKGRLVIPSGTTHCFTCGHTCNIIELISYCFGYNDGGMFGAKWLKANYRSNLVEKERKLDLQIERKRKGGRPAIETGVPEEVLDSFRYTVDYMYERGLTDEIIEKFDIGYCREQDAITIPVKDLRGYVRWVQMRCIAYKRYIIPSGITKTDFLLGAYECLQEYNMEPVYIVESPFNMLTLWKLGYRAVCLFGTGGGKQYDYLKKLPFRHYVLALDNDEAGREGTQRLIKELCQYKMLSRVKYRDGRDINELDEEFKDLKIIKIL